MNSDPLVGVATIAEETTPGRDASDLTQFEHPSVIVNADDWGRDVATTATALECVTRGAVSSVSAMVFMEDSERAAGLARQHGVDAGLHLNLTTPFTSRQCPDRMRSQQEKVAGFLRFHRLAQVLYHPGLITPFDYLVRTQFDEFERIYGLQPERVDGHHHMHLSANVLRPKLIPEGIIVFALRPMDTARMAEILGLANRFDVEIVTHPLNREECDFLKRGGFTRCLEGVAINRGYRLRADNPPVREAQFLEEPQKS